MTERRWLERELARGLQGLVALRLNGAPAEDSITLTLDVWLAAVSGMARGWHEHLDAPRIRKAFATLYRTCERWPAPGQLLGCLEHRPVPAALPVPAVTEEQRQKNLLRIQAIKKTLRENLEVKKP